MIGLILLLPCFNYEKSTLKSKVSYETNKYLSMGNELIKIGDFKLKSKHSDRSFIADARYLRTNEKKPIVLFVHGFKGFKDWGHFNLIADSFAMAGFVFVKLNLSHNGTTPDHPIDFVDLEAFSDNNFSIELDDIGVLIDYLNSDQSIIPTGELFINNLHLLGHSRGASLVLLKAAEDKRITSVTAWAPISNLQERWPTEVRQQWQIDGVSHVYNGRTKQDMPMKYQFIEDLVTNMSRLDVPQAVETMGKPMLLIHGTEDTTLAYQDTVELAKTNDSAQMNLIEKANHVFGGTHPYPLNQKELPEHTQKAIKLTLVFLISM